MFRFDSRTGFFFYPSENDTKDCVLYVNKGTSYKNNVQKRDDIKVIKHCFIIPQNASDYNDFTDQMKAQEAKFLKKLNTYELM